MNIKYVNPADASMAESSSTSLASFRRRVTILTPSVHLVSEVTSIAMQEPIVSKWIEYLDPEIESIRDSVRRLIREAKPSPAFQYDPVSGSTYRGFASEDLDDEL